VCRNMFLGICVYDNLQANIYWQSIDGTILGYNDGMRRYFQCDGNELVGKKACEIVSKDEASRINAIDREIVNTGIAKIYEENVVYDGKHATYITHKKPIRDKDGKIVGLVGVSINITELKIAKEKNKKLENQKIISEERNRITKILSNSIAHEIGNLLATININFELLKMNVNKETIVHGSYDKIIDNIKTLEKCINNAKNILKSLKTNIKQESLDISQFERSLIKDDINSVLSLYFQDEPIVQKINLDISKNFYYKGITSYTRNVLINLFKNAIYFIKEYNKGEISITLSTDTDKKYNKLIFQDSAIGIKQKDREKIFSSFFTTRRGGSGMGLSFCKMVMEAYGGDIICESEYGKYTRFILLFKKI